MPHEVAPAAGRRRPTRRRRRPAGSTRSSTTAIARWCSSRPARCGSITRNGHDWTHRYGALAKAFEKLACKSAILDGEVVVQDPRGVTSINLLEQALSEGDQHAFTYFAFDLVYLDGFDLSGAKLVERKAALEGLVGPLIDERSADPAQRARRGRRRRPVRPGQPDRPGRHRLQEGRRPLRADPLADLGEGQARRDRRLRGDRLHVEHAEGGLVADRRRGARRRAGLRLPGRLRHRRRQGSRTPCDAVEAGDPQPRRAGPEDAGGALGRAGVDRADRLPQPLVAGRAARAGVHGHLGPQGRPAGGDQAAADRRPRAGGDPPDQPRARDVRRQRRHQARPGALLRPGRRLAAAGAAAPAGDGDPLPDRRRSRTCSTSATPSPACRRASQTIDLADEEGRGAFITITEPKGFLGLTQFGAVEFHLWGCRIDDPEHPDRLVMDLDPDEALPWARVCDGAEMLKARLEQLGFRPFLRTTGGKGLHLVMALAGAPDWPLVKGFAEALSRAMAADAPSLFTANAIKAQRRGKIYLDYLRNARGASAIGVLLAARQAELPGRHADRLGGGAQAVGRRRLRSSQCREAPSDPGGRPVG